MKKLLLLLAIFMLGCQTYETQKFCSVEQKELGVQVTCPNGSSGFIKNDKNVDNIQTIKFCKKHKEEHLKDFPEYGICVNDTLYAVYLDKNNARLVHISPGYYVSTSAITHCDFQVANKCQINEME